MGTHVVSGTARPWSSRTGRATEFGKVSERLKLRPPETDFERGVRRFGYLLMEVTLVLVLAIFAINVYFQRPVLDSFLFSLALAVGLTPQLLPAIISINLAHGAKRMAQAKVIVQAPGVDRELRQHERALLRQDGHPDRRSRAVAFRARTCRARRARRCCSTPTSTRSTRRASPIPSTRRSAPIVAFDVSGYKKLDEVPYDFMRKRLSILVSQGDRRLLVTKGALENVLEVCSTAETADGAKQDIAAVRDADRRSASRS